MGQRGQQRCSEAPLSNPSLCLAGCNLVLSMTMTLILCTCWALLNSLTSHETLEAARVISGLVPELTFFFKVMKLIYLHEV